MFVKAIQVIPELASSGIHKNIKRLVRSTDKPFFKISMGGFGAEALEWSSRLSMAVGEVGAAEAEVERRPGE